MTTRKKTKSQKCEQSLDSSSCETESTPKKSPLAEMTSGDYQRLNRGEPNLEQIDTYIGMKVSISRKVILDQQIKSMAEADAASFRQAMDRSAQIHHEIVWEKRREQVVEMHHATLDSLAKHYGILPGAECIRDHPDADDLDKGPLLARLYQFLVWDGEYHGTALEMRATDVEAAIEAAKTWTKGWQPSDTEILESVLHRASACKKANDNLLLQALKECIAVTCACPSLKKKLTLKIKNAAEQIDDIGDTKNHDKPNEAKASLNAVKERLGDHEEKLQEIRSYLDGFTPGKDMPQIVKDETDKWFVGQFNVGKPVGSIVRVAWLVDVFHSFWGQHQSAYLASDPSQRELQKKASEHGKHGVAKKADTKWRRFTLKFVEYVSNGERSADNLSPDQLQTQTDDFGMQLMAQKTKGATDKRAVKHIKEFISTLATLMDRNADEDEVQITWKRLSTGVADQRKEKVFNDCFFDESPRRARQGDRASAKEIDSAADDSSTHADKKLRGKAGKFRKSAFSSLPLETFKECLEILRAALQHRKAQPGAGGRP